MLIVIQAGVLQQTNFKKKSNLTFFIQNEVVIYKHTNLDLDFVVTHFCLGDQVSQRPSLSNSCDI